MLVVEVEERVENGPDSDRAYLLVEHDLLEVGALLQTLVHLVLEQFAQLLNTVLVAFTTVVLEDVLSRLVLVGSTLGRRFLLLSHYIIIVILLYLFKSIRFY
jgi:hypothetical protein